MIEHIRKTKSSLKQLIVPGMFFEDMGITYLGPIQGHSIPILVRALKEARKIEGPVLLHVLTKKGKGYEPAEEQPDKFHGIGPFQVETGEPEKQCVMKRQEMINLRRSLQQWQMERVLRDFERNIRTAFLMWGLRKNMR